MTRAERESPAAAPVGRRLFLYNTVCEIVLYAWEGDARALLDGCEIIARDVQRMLSLYDPASELSRLCAEAVAGEPYPVSGPLFAFLADMLAFAGESGGAFEPRIGPLVRLWDFTSATPRVPAQNEIDAAREAIAGQAIRLDAEGRTVTFAQPGACLDAGGAGKGYAVERVADYLRANGVLSASLNFGGNLCVIGPCYDDAGNPRDWRVGVQQPWAARSQALGALSLRDLAVATSGGYDRYFTVGDQVYHHILDPHTGYPADSGLTAVTIVSSRPMMTDLMSTAFFVLGQEEGARLCRRLGARMVMEYIAVTPQGVTVSPGLAGRYAPTPAPGTAVPEAMGGRGNGIP